MKKQLFEFIEFDTFYQYYKPLTPYGIATKNRKEIFYDSETLATQFDQTEVLIEYLNRSSQKADKVEYHLKRISELPLFKKESYDSIDLFQIKKFLMNYKEVVALLSEKVKEKLNLSFDSDELLELFFKGGSSESFYISDSYSDELKQVRIEIQRNSEELKRIKSERITEIKERFGYDFSLRDFLVIEENATLKPDKDFFYIEPFDSTHVVIKPVFPDSYFELHKKKDSLLTVELACEKSVLLTLSEKVNGEKKNLEKYKSLVEKLDITCAKARLALKFNMTRPELLSSEKMISINEARYIPQCEKCEKLKTTYSPLTASFSDRVIVIHGSNMSGKTVLLKSVGFFQILTQMGFFVPAKKYAAPLFEQIFYIGENATEKVEGLSGFGLEIHNFMIARKNREKRTFYLIDEFARTTNSLEATALISAVLKEFTEEANSYALLSTHFMGLPSLNQLSFYKMEGVDSKEYEKCYQKENLYSLVERIQLINSFMRYNVVLDSNRKPSYDAIKIAEILGLNHETVEYAYRYLGGKNEK